MTKEEVIQEAYGKAWEFAKEFVDNNGWIERSKQSVYLNIGSWGVDRTPIKNFLGFNDYKGIEEGFSGTKYRPKSLRGIETNNGWIKGTPTEKGQYFTFFSNGYVEAVIFDDNLDTIKFWKLNFTHYQQIIKPKPPIY